MPSLVHHFHLPLLPLPPLPSLPLPLLPISLISFTLIIYTPYDSSKIFDQIVSHQIFGHSGLHDLTTNGYPSYWMKTLSCLSNMSNPIPPHLIPLLYLINWQISWLQQLTQISILELLCSQHLHLILTPCGVKV